ncbi:MAG: hypothetical protein KC731_17900, partial [Myxococcales bacterium]|nr:hypothetical protein [Myxococcales bacterium]
DGDEKPRVLPAIPLTTPGASKPDGDEKPRVLPAIPLGGMGAATPARPRPSTEEEIAVEIRRRLTHQLRWTAGRYFGALLAAGRHEEADAVAAAAVRHAGDRTTRLALVEGAIRARQTEARREEVLRWLEESR